MTVRTDFEGFQHNFSGEYAAADFLLCRAASAQFGGGFLQLSAVNTDRFGNRRIAGDILYRQRVFLCNVFLCVGFRWQNVR